MHARARSAGRPTPRTEAAGAAPVRRGRRRAPPGRGPRQRLRLGEVVRVRVSQRLEEHPVRVAGDACERRPEPVQQHDGAPMDERRALAPQPEREPEHEVRRGERPELLTCPVCAVPRHRDDDRVERSVELRRAQRSCRAGAPRRAPRRAGPQAPRQRRHAGRATGAARAWRRQAERCVRAATAISRCASTVSRSHGQPSYRPVSRGWSSTIETPIRRYAPGQHRLRGRYRAASPATCAGSSSESAVAARGGSGPQAPSSAAGPPWRTVSAAVTVTTRSVSTSGSATRIGTSCDARRGRGATRSRTSCTTTSPRKSRARAGGNSASSSRRPARRSRPPAIEHGLVGRGRSRRASARRARRPAPHVADRRSYPGIGRIGGSTTTVAPAARASPAPRAAGPASGKRSASPTAAPTSVIGSSGGGADEQHGVLREIDGVQARAGEERDTHPAIQAGRAVAPDVGYGIDR